MMKEVQLFEVWQGYRESLSPKIQLSVSLVFQMKLDEGIYELV
jgi:hypothetical protein